MNGNKLADLLTSVNLVVFTAIVTLAAGAFFLARGIADRSAVAYLILGGLVALALAGLGGAGVLGVMFFQSVMARRRDEVERERWQANAAENLAIMASMQKVQNLQNTQLLKQARETQRMLPAGGDVLDVDALLIDDAVFDELDD